MKKTFKKILPFISLVLVALLITTFITINNNEIIEDDSYNEQIKPSPMAYESSITASEWSTLQSWGYSFTSGYQVEGDTPLNYCIDGKVMSLGRTEINILTFNNTYRYYYAYHGYLSENLYNALYTLTVSNNTNPAYTKIELSGSIYTTGYGLSTPQSYASIYKDSSNRPFFKTYDSRGTESSVRVYLTKTGVVVGSTSSGPAVSDSSTLQTAVSVTIAKTGSGTTNLSGTYTYYAGQSLSLTATPSIGYSFTGWYNASNQLVSSYSSYTVTLGTTAQTYTARFTANLYTISVSGNTGGTVRGGGSYTYNTKVTLKATASTGYSFAGWYQSGTRVSTSSSYQITVGTSAASYSAVFTPNYYSITATTTTPGTVDGSGSFAFGTTPTLTATPNEGYSLDGWYDASGTKVSSSLIYKPDVKANNATYTANFTINSYTITAKAETGGTTLGTASYVYNSKAKLTAILGEGYSFDGWYNASGAKVSSSLIYEPTVLASNATYTAKFTINYYTITVTTKTPGKVEGSGSFAYGTTPTLKATPSEGYSLEGWYDSSNKKVSTSLIYKPTVGASNATYTANFTINSYTITAKAETGGTVSGTKDYVYNSKATLEATPSTGYSFDGWYDASNKKVSSSLIYEPTVSASNATYTAKFTINSYTITAKAETGGTVLGTASYVYNTKAELKATPSTGYSFDGWYDASNKKVSSSLIYEPTVGATDATYTAKFTINSYTITAKAETGGTTLGTASYVYNTKAELKATPSTGYSFDGWYDSSNKKVSSSLIYEPTVSASNATYTAKFTINSYQITAKAQGGGTVSGTKDYVYNTNAELKATPKLGYSLEGWYDSSNKKVSSSLIFTPTVGASDATYTAKFTINSYEMKVIASNSLYGDVLLKYKTFSGTSKVIDFAETFTISASAKRGYKFMGWYTNPSYTGNPLSMQKSLTITINSEGNVTYYAKFSQEGIHVSSSYTNDQTKKQYNNLADAISYATKSSDSEDLLIYIDGEVGSLYQNHVTFVNDNASYILYDSSKEINVIGIGSNNVIYNNASNSLIDVANGKVVFSNVTLCGASKNNVAGNQDNALLRVSGGELVLNEGTIVTNNYNIGSGIHYTSNWCPGAIDVYDGILRMDNAIVADNTTTYGGDIFVHQNAEVFIKDSSIINSSNAAVYAEKNSSVNIEGNCDIENVYLDSTSTFKVSSLSNDITVYKDKQMTENSVIGETDLQSASHIKASINSTDSLVGLYDDGNLVWDSTTLVKSKLQEAIEKAIIEKEFSIIEGEAKAISDLLGENIYHLSDCLYVGSIETNDALISSSGKRIVVTSENAGEILLTLKNVRVESCEFYGTLVIDEITIPVKVLPTLGTIISSQDSIVLTNVDKDTLYSIKDSNQNLMQTVKPSYDEKTNEYYVKFEGLESTTKYVVSSSKNNTTNYEEVTTSSKNAIISAAENASYVKINQNEDVSLKDILSIYIPHLDSCIEVSEVKVDDNITLSSSGIDSIINASTPGYYDISFNIKANENCAIYEKQDFQKCTIKVSVLPNLEDAQIVTTKNSITLPSLPGYSYDFGSSSVFSSLNEELTVENLIPNKEYTVVVRYTFDDNGVQTTIENEIVVKTKRDEESKESLIAGINESINAVNESFKDLKVSDDMQNITSEIVSLLTKDLESKDIEELKTIDDVINKLIEYLEKEDFVDVLSKDSAENTDNLSEFLEIIKDQESSYILNELNQNENINEIVTDFEDQTALIISNSTEKEVNEILEYYNTLTDSAKEMLFEEYLSLIEKLASIISLQIDSSLSLTNTDKDELHSQITSIMESAKVNTDKIDTLNFILDKTNTLNEIKELENEVLNDSYINPNEVLSLEVETTLAASKEILNSVREDLIHSIGLKYTSDLKEAIIYQTTILNIDIMSLTNETDENILKTHTNQEIISLTRAYKESLKTLVNDKLDILLDKEANNALVNATIKEEAKKAVDDILLCNDLLNDYFDTDRTSDCEEMIFSCLEDKSEALINNVLSLSDEEIANELDVIKESSVYEEDYFMNELMMEIESVKEEFASHIANSDYLKASSTQELFDKLVEVDDKTTTLFEEEKHDYVNYLVSIIAEKYELLESTLLENLTNKTSTEEVIDDIDTLNDIYNQAVNEESDDVYQDKLIEDSISVIDTFIKETFVPSVINEENYSTTIDDYLTEYETLITNYDYALTKVDNIHDSLTIYAEDELNKLSISLIEEIITSINESSESLLNNTQVALFDEFKDIVNKYNSFSNDPTSHILILEDTLINMIKDTSDEVIKDINNEEYSSEYDNYLQLIASVNELTENEQYNNLLQEKMISSLTSLYEEIAYSGLYYEEDIPNTTIVDDITNDINTALGKDEIKDVFNTYYNDLDSINTAYFEAVKSLESNLESIKESNEYQEDAITEIESFINSFKESFNEATSVATIIKALDDVENKISEVDKFAAVASSLLDEYIAKLKEENAYYEEEEHMIASITSSFNEYLNTPIIEEGSPRLPSVSEIKEEYSKVTENIDEVLTANEVAINTINEKMNTYIETDYTPKNYETIKEYYNKAINDLANETLDISNIDEVVDFFNKTTISVETISKASFAKVKAEAIYTLDSYISNENAQIDSYIKDAISEIKDMKLSDEVNKNTVIDVLKEHVETIESLYKTEIESNLDNLSNIYSADSYSQASYQEIEEIIESAKETLPSVTNAEELKNYIDNVVLALDDVFTLVEEKREETKAELDSFFETLKEDNPYVASIHSLEEVKENIEKDIDSITLLDQFEEKLPEWKDLLTDEFTKESIKNIDEIITSKIDQFKENQTEELEAEIDSLIDEYVNLGADKENIALLDDYELICLKKEALAEAEKEANLLNKDDYSVYYYSEIQKIKEDFKAELENITEVTEVNESLEQFINNINEVPTKEEEKVSTSKDNAIKYLTSLKNESSSVNQLVESIIEKVNTATTVDGVNSVVNENVSSIYKEYISDLLKEYENTLDGDCFKGLLENYMENIVSVSNNELADFYNDLLSDIDVLESYLDDINTYLPSSLKVSQLVNDLKTSVGKASTIKDITNIYNMGIYNIEKQILTDKKAEAINDLGALEEKYTSLEKLYNPENYQNILSIIKESYDSVTNAKVAENIDIIMANAINKIESIDTIASDACKKLQETLLNDSSSQESKDIVNKYTEEIESIIITDDQTFIYENNEYDNISDIIDIITKKAENEVTIQENTEFIEKTKEEILALYNEFVASQRYSDAGVELLKEYADEAIASLEEMDVTEENIKEKAAELFEDTKDSFRTVKAKLAITSDGVAALGDTEIDYDQNYDPSNNGYFGGVESSTDNIDHELSLVIEEQKGFYFEIAINNYESRTNKEEDELTKSELKVLFDIYLSQNGSRIELSEDGTYYTVRILIPEQYRSIRDLKIVYMADNGEITTHESERTGNFLVFTTTHFSDYGLIGLTHLEQTRVEQQELVVDYLSKLDTSLYKHEQYQDIRNQYNEVLSRLESQTVSAADMVTIVLEFISNVENTPTALDISKQDAINSLKNELNAVDESKYTNKGYQEIVASINDAMKKVNEASSIEEVEVIFEQTKTFLTSQTTLGMILAITFIAILVALILIIIILHRFYFKLNVVAVFDDDTLVLDQKETFWLFTINPDDYITTFNQEKPKGVFFDKNLTTEASSFKMPFGQANLYLSFTDKVKDVIELQEEIAPKKEKKSRHMAFIDLRTIKKMYKDGDVVSYDTLLKKNIITKNITYIRIIDSKNTRFTTKITARVNYISKTVQNRITSCGGTIEDVDNGGK